MSSSILGLSLLAVRESAVKAALDHGMIGTEAEEYGDGVMFHASQTMIALMEKERDAVLDRGDGRCGSE